MPKLVIATDPAHDVVTQHLSYWVEEITKQVSTIEDLEIKVLQGADAAAENLTELLENEDSHLILLNGHGGYEVVYGHNDITLLAASTSDLSLFAEKIIHAFSCSSGRDLGPALINNGARAFIGYKEPFQFYHSKSNPDSNVKDALASLFLEPAHEVARLLCEGKSAKTAFDQSQALYRSNLLLVLTNAGPNAPLLSAALFHDLKNQVMLGSPEAAM